MQLIPLVRIVLASYFFVDGIFEIAAAFRLRSAHGWGWMFFGSLFWAALIGMVLWAVLRGQQTGQNKPDPEAILAERFALGEISSEEFSERRRALRQ